MVRENEDSDITWHCRERDGLKGERIAVFFKNVGDHQFKKDAKVIPSSGEHRAMYKVVYGNPAKAFIVKPVRGVESIGVRSV